MSKTKVPRLQYPEGGVTLITISCSLLASGNTSWQPSGKFPVRSWTSVKGEIQLL